MTESFDVFLSHNSKDKPAVRELAEALRARGLKVWLDEWELVPGRRWQKALEETIETTGAAAVLVGKDGLGPWQEQEMEGCLSEFVQRKLPVIPVLLPGAPEAPKLPLFLRGLTWVDLRSGLNEKGLDQLQWGITGTKPPEGLTHSSTLIAAPEAQPASPERGPEPLPSRAPGTMPQDSPKRWFVRPLLLAATSLAVVVALGAFLAERLGRGAGEIVSLQDEPLKEPDRASTPTVDCACFSEKNRLTYWVNGIAYIRICSGDFTRGSSYYDSLADVDEKPDHSVTLSEFLISKTEITNEQYRRFRPGHPGEARAPATNVTWPDAKAACEYFGGRLPTEAQWEYAARAGSRTAWSFGDDERDLSEYAWYAGNSNDAPHPVGTKKPNAWGLHDMHGNVWEWVADRYGPYSSAAQADPLGPSAGTLRVLRGGAFAGSPRFLRSADRYEIEPEVRSRGIGFRCTRSPRRTS